MLFNQIVLIFLIHIFLDSCCLRSGLYLTSARKSRGLYTKKTPKQPFQAFRIVYSFLFSAYIHTSSTLPAHIKQSVTLYNNLLFNQIVLIFLIHIFLDSCCLRSGLYLTSARKSASPSTGKMDGGQVQCRGVSYRYIHLTYLHTLFLYT